MAAEVGAMMASSALRILVPGLLLPTLMAHAGGWAVITVQDLPDYVEAGKRVDLSYTVRQHGRTRLDQLRGNIEATSGRLTATGMVVPGAQPGSYTASITLPSAGDWSITIRSGFGRSDVTLLPLAAVEHGAALTRPVTDPERGRRLFVSKGCVTCHEQIEVGPKLGGRRFDVADISGFLANPPSTPSRGGSSPMPNLGLQQREIASLVSFLNSDRQVTTR
jgi:mono/diheme cytochrome c family protein